MHRDERQTGEGSNEGLTPLGRLGQYMNFRRLFSEPPVIVTEDHRAVLVAAWAAQREARFGGIAPLLVRLDAHPDLGEKPRDWQYEKACLSDLDAVHSIVNDQRHDDGGWVISAMQFGLAADVITCFVHDYHRFPGDNGTYTDHEGTSHRLRTSPTLVDHPSIRTAPALWLDIDLDFATARLEDGTCRLWNASEWDEYLGGDGLALLSQWFRRAALVTVATEPEFCGGLMASARIAEELKSRLLTHGDWLGKL